MMPEIVSSKKVKLYLILISIAIAVSIWQFYKYKIADKSIHKLVTRKGKGLYNIHYNDLTIDEINGSLSAESILISADTSVYNKMESTNRPSIPVKIYVPALKVIHLATPKALLTKEISCQQLNIDSPDIEISLIDFLKDTSGYSPGEEIYKEILGNLKVFRLLVLPFQWFPLLFP